MNLPAAFHLVCCLVRDTFRQSLASRSFWLMLGLTGLIVCFCFSLRVQGVTAYQPPGENELYGADEKMYTGLNPGRGQLQVAFGLVSVPLWRDGPAAAAFLHNVLAILAGFAGMVLLLLWTAGFLPEFLEERSAAVLLAKPVPRALLLLGKFLGVVVLVAFQITVFVLGTWVALGVGTGSWFPGYLLGIPLLVLEFATLYSFAALMAVWTRSTGCSLALTLAFLTLCGAVNARHHDLLQPGRTVSPAAQKVANTAYWVLPKPTDAVYLWTEVLGSASHFSGAGPNEVRVSEPELSVFTSLLVSAALLALAGRRLHRWDY